MPCKMPCKMPVARRLHLRWQLSICEAPVPFHALHCRVTPSFFHAPVLCVGAGLLAAGRQRPGPNAGSGQRRPRHAAELCAGAECAAGAFRPVGGLAQGAGIGPAAPRRHGRPGRAFGGGHRHGLPLFGQCRPGPCPPRRGRGRIDAAAAAGPGHCPAAQPAVQLQPAAQELGGLGQCVGRLAAVCGRAVRRRAPAARRHGRRGPGRCHQQQRAAADAASAALFHGPAGGTRRGPAPAGAGGCAGP